jgi:hypothetical protein
VKTIYKEEGLPGFYKGAKITIVSVPIFYSLYFPIYEKFKQFFALKIHNDVNKNDLIVYSLAASSAAIICDFITNPLWMIRIQHQTEYITTGNSKTDSFNIIKPIKELYKKVKFIFIIYF